MEDLAAVRLGMCFDRTFPPALVVDVARRLEAGGLDDLWVIEDCFYTAGVSLAAAALTATERLTVGIGILPAVARNPAITAMELATLAGLAPGRVIAGLGHGVQSWMAQMGVRPSSPLAALEEALVVVRRLLAGEQVTFDGRTVRLDGVVIDRPPDPVPLVLAGVRGPRSLAMAGTAADGIVLAELTPADAVRAAIDQAGSPQPFEVVVYTATHIAADRRAAREAYAPQLAAAVVAPPPALAAAPYHRELADVVARRGPAGLVDVDDAIWTDLCAVGDPDDVRANLAALSAAGAGRVACFPLADAEVAGEQLRWLADHVVGR